MRVIPLIISISSLALSTTSLIITIKTIKRNNRIKKTYLDRLKQSQINNYKIYNFIRLKRNNAMKKRMIFETEYRKSLRPRLRFANRVCLFSSQKEEQILRDIEEYMQKEHLIEI